MGLKLSKCPHRGMRRPNVSWLKTHSRKRADEDPVDAQLPFEFVSSEFSKEEVPLC